jgi:endonuclease/exonuclease/phosphatase (EEP) superfamily protein YafD
MSQTLKIIQFNVWDRNRDPAATARWILAENADIVVIEEAGLRGEAVIEAISSQYLHRTTCAEAEICPTSILSKVPSRGGGTLTPDGLESRHAAAWATFGDGATAFSVAGTHFQWPEPIGAQDPQARLFAQMLDRFDPGTLIVAGDFNLTPWSFTLRRQDGRFGLIRRSRALATWPAGKIEHWGVNFPFPFLPIDHIYAGKAWKTVSVVRGPCLGSDHFPIVAVLTRDL